MRWSPPSPLDSVRLPPVDVAAIRIRLHMTQQQFARRFGFPLTTLRHWEQEDRQPTGAALTLLHVIRESPGIVAQALGRVRFRARNDSLAKEPLTLAQVLERLDPGGPPRRR
jgi:putative transcriptional regulator